MSAGPPGTGQGCILWCPSLVWPCHLPPHGTPQVMHGDGLHAPDPPGLLQLEKDFQVNLIRTFPLLRVTGEERGYLL